MTQNSVQAVVAKIDLLRKEQALLEIELKSMIRTICNAYDPHTRKLTYAKPPRFDFTEDDLPMALRKVPKTAPTKWLFLTNPDYAVTKKQAQDILEAYLRKNYATYAEDLELKIQALESQIRRLYNQMEIPHAS